MVWPLFLTQSQMKDGYLIELLPTETRHKDLNSHCRTHAAQLSQRGWKEPTECSCSFFRRFTEEGKYPILSAAFSVFTCFHRPSLARIFSMRKAQNLISKLINKCYEINLSGENRKAHVEDYVYKCLIIFSWLLSFDSVRYGESVTGSSTFWYNALKKNREHIFSNGVISVNFPW